MSTPTTAWIERWAQAHPPARRTTPKTLVVSVNASLEERERIRSWANAQGLSMSTACLLAILRAMRNEEPRQGG